MLELAKSYADAGYFARNLRAIEVLVDQEIVRSGRAVTELWKFYDLGHGYCTYDFFDQCPAQDGLCEVQLLCSQGRVASTVAPGKNQLASAPSGDTAERLGIGRG